MLALLSAKAILKSFTIFFFSAEQLPNIIMDIKQISMQWKSAKKYKLGGI